MTTGRVALDNGIDAVRVHVQGVVQGVGFRPFVHRLATRYGLAGWIRNEGGGVQIAVEGDPACLLSFLERLTADAPPLARIDALEVTRTDREHHDGFTIAASTEQADRRQPISPDIALCEACEAELFDPANGRYRYPFITCTDCGPRFTVIESMPYDRERTSMQAFVQCRECAREYETPWDRRFHSETNSCPRCGPSVQFVTAGGAPERGTDVDAIQHAARLLRIGLVVAIRGLGGFHLAVDATDELAVQRLRRRKRREAKPLAVMVRTVDEARRLGHVGPVEERLLTCRERPIVLLRKDSRSPLAPSIAPALDTVGVMTAYTPLHHLLLDVVDTPLVMTSGNVSEEPIAISNADALARLCEIADAFLLHDREIVARYDDSVVRVVDEAPVFLRRARGYAPLPVTLPVATPRPLLAVGPHLKNTFTLACGNDAYVSQHVGNLENLETLAHFESSLATYKRLFRIRPEVVVRDRHPGYLSTRIAEELGLPVIAVQHHHAHVAAVAAEHGVTDPVIGIAYDGTGYGEDGNVWGAEVLVADLADFRRAAHLRYAALPGSELAVRDPWRTALGYLALEPDATPAFRRAFQEISDEERHVAEQQLARGLNSPFASSMGRLFDAAAAVLGVRRAVQFEGQAAMELEALAGSAVARALPFPILDDDDGFVLDPLPLLVALGERAAAGDAAQDLAARFHESVARATSELACKVRTATGIETAALGGGVFQNARLLSRLTQLLRDVGFDVLVPRRLGPNDGAISYGQAAVAATLLTHANGV